MKTAFGVAWKAVLVICILGGVAALLSFRLFNVPAGSMIPTLKVGDYMVVSVTPYGLSKYGLPGRFELFEGRFFPHNPERGDVVVFALPRDPSTIYVKRLIGLPGDTIQMKQGRLYINGDMVAREPAPKLRTEDYYGRENEVPAYKETLPGGRSYEIIEIQGDTGFNDNTEPFKVPAGNFFSLGDNRDNSMDSRVPPDQGGVGYVPLDNLVGRVELVYFSLPKGGAPSFPMRRVR